MVGICCRVVFPFTDASGAKDRPAVVYAGPDAHSDVELLMITSQAHHADAVPIRSADYLRGPLPRASFVRLGRPLKVQAARLRFLSCVLKPDFMDRLRRAVVLSETRRFQQERHGKARPARRNRSAPAKTRCATRAATSMRRNWSISWILRWISG
jgi:hypothetical protein